MYVCMYVCMYICIYICTNDPECSPAELISKDILFRIHEKCFAFTRTVIALIKVFDTPSPYKKVHIYTKVNKLLFDIKPFYRSSLKIPSNKSSYIHLLAQTVLFTFACLFAIVVTEIAGLSGLPC